MVDRAVAHRMRWELECWSQGSGRAPAQAPAQTPSGLRASEYVIEIQTNKLNMNPEEKRELSALHYFFSLSLSRSSSFSPSFSFFSTVEPYGSWAAAELARVTLNS